MTSSSGQVEESVDNVTRDVIFKLQQVDNVVVGVSVVFRYALYQCKFVLVLESKSYDDECLMKALH